MDLQKIQQTEYLRGITLSSRAILGNIALCFVYVCYAHGEKKSEHTKVFKLFQEAAVIGLYMYVEELSKIKTHILVFSLLLNQNSPSHTIM